MPDLLSRWTALVGHTESAVGVGLDLLDRWSQPHRHYHSVPHLRAVLDALDILDAEIRSATAVRLAAWFHDAVYDGRPGDDETASAALAAQQLTRLGRNLAEVAEVQRLVMITRAHDPATDDADGAALCDADLSVLASAPDDYRAYVTAVRRDYAHIDDHHFRAGRIDVLERLLSHRSLFRTKTGRQLWEATARRNITDELDQLRT
ncbi:HD domain-containing protein [Phytoactinopolyspora limicola]|uniref:HD domain-containing protein n=1 Tax=Phytoactinopolyspora limicola TaxID=2715536 RepID=UPI00140C86D8|nr:metal-dependent phosphohydrolase [Phytoactinopolyspora limicola]